MNKKLTILSVLLISILILTACNSQELLINDDIKFYGDLENHLSIKEIIKNVDAVEYEYNEKKVVAYEMSSIIEKIKPLMAEYDLIIKSDDYFSVRLSGEGLEGTHLVYDQNEKWVYLSEVHPKNSKVKNINEIIIVSKVVDYGLGLNIIDAEETINYSLGALHSRGYQLVPMIDGNTSKTVDGKRYEIDVMKYKKMIPLNNLADTEASTIMVATRTGEFEYLSNQDIYVLLDSNNLGIYDYNRDTTYSDVVGVMLNPPDMSNLEIYGMVEKYLENEEKVLLILVDGFSYFQYQDYVMDNPDFYMSGIETSYKSTTVYKPVTNSGMTAILTGVKPAISGVLDRSYREVKSKTIFERADELNKSNILIEGDINILNISVETILNFDKNKDGFFDDDVFDSAMENLDKDLVFVHFHNVDDSGHDTGPDSKETLERIKVTDGYIRQLADSWSGKLIIVSDHGMHKTEEGGDHGDFIAQDMYVPILVTDGEK